MRYNTRPRQEFLPTPSARRATATRSDINEGFALFLPTPSARRATINTLSGKVELLLFLPTPSARRATTLTDTTSIDTPISTHALREEGDG